MIGLKRGLVELHDHEKEWEENAVLIIEKLKSIFGAAATNIQHVGSTSIVHIKAKPIIDIAVAATSLDIAPMIPALEAEGMIHRPENDDPCQVFFSCGNDKENTRTHHIHVVKDGSKEWQDYINFRDYLNARPDAAREYENVKLRLMNEYRNDRLSYTEGKAAFIKDALRKALTWRYLGNQFYHSEIETAHAKVIHILGASGSGTTTLGRAISKNFGFTHFDSDDFFWLPTNPPYTAKRKPEERQKLLAEAMAKSGKSVISGSLCGWGDRFIPEFDLVIFIDTPASVRVERLKEREYRHFGSRILPGGDMYENHAEFINWAEKYDTSGFEQRSKILHMDWLKNITCPVITVDGSHPIEATLRQIEKSIYK